jgi:hypothetical protein
MTTVDKAIADQIMRDHGGYKGDPVVEVIIRYKNMFDGAYAYKLVYNGSNLDYYMDLETFIDPEIWWERE